jgi:hypothetical protein
MTDNWVHRFMAALGLAAALLVLAFGALEGRALAGRAPARMDGEVAVLQATGSFTVYGRVISAPDGPGIGGVQVFVWDRDGGTGEVRATSAGDGSYSATLEAGSWDLIFNPPCGDGFASRSYKGIQGPPDVPLTAPLTAGHSVSGRVYADDGATPVPGTAIYGFNQETAEGFGLPMADGDGRYCVGLAAGRYYLGFTPPPCQDRGPRTISLTVLASVITDVILVPGFTVAGCVSDGVGGLVSGVQVYAYDPAPDVGGFGFAPTDETGCYTGTLPLGVFDFQFIPPAWLGLGSLTITDVVNQGAGCPDTPLPVTLPAGFTLYGWTTCGGVPVRNVFVFADPAGPPAPGDNLDGWGLFSVDDGSYELPLAPGTYDLEFIPPPASGFASRMVTSVLINTDTLVIVDFCPIRLPVIFKNYRS